jgi:hypothetical protein
MVMCKHRGVYYGNSGMAPYAASKAYMLMVRALLLQEKLMAEKLIMQSALALGMKEDEFRNIPKLDCLAAVRQGALRARSNGGFSMCPPRRGEQTVDFLVKIYKHILELNQESGRAQKILFPVRCFTWSH